ncbi:hypothetical protein P692DRAFT_20608817 [Suillus brevipes Sb2]|nr:hypothetical protein P692DRAFT_20608817 [Suillus brevipes Sb2]
MIAPRQHFIREPDRCHRSRRNCGTQILGHITTSYVLNNSVFQNTTAAATSPERNHREFKTLTEDTLWDSPDAHFHRKLIAKDRNPSDCFHASRHRVRPESLNKQVLLIEKHVPVSTIKKIHQRWCPENAKRVIEDTD